MPDSEWADSLFDPIKDYITKLEKQVDVLDKAIKRIISEHETLPKKYVMVLNDGETYSDLQGCKIVEFDAKVDVEEVEGMLKQLRYKPETNLEAAKVISTYGPLYEGFQPKRD